MEALIPFATVYISESGMPTLVTIKTKKIEIDGMSNMTFELP
jgi:hypothetical protein